MPQNCANKHLFGITDEIFFSLTDQDGEMASELKKKISERMRQREREKQTKRKLQRNQPLLNYIETPQDPI